MNCLLGAARYLRFHLLQVDFIKNFWAIDSRYQAAQTTIGLLFILMNNFIYPCLITLRDDVMEPPQGVGPIQPTRPNYDANKTINILGH